MLRKLPVLFIFIFLSKLSYSQGTSGKNFWVAFLEAQLYCGTRDTMIQPAPGPYDQDTLELYITSQYKAKVTVYGANGIDVSFTNTFVLTPGKTYYFRVPPHMSNRNAFVEEIHTFAVNITSDSLINVQAVNRFWSSKGSTNVIPAESIPMAPEYYITTNESEIQYLCNFVTFNGYRKIYKTSEFVVVGVSDTSIIEIVPSGVSSWFDNKRNRPFNVTLKKGETFHYMTSDNDLTGSIIRSRTTRSKFVVFAGNRQTYSNPKDTINIPCASSVPYSVYTYNKNKLNDLALVDHTYEQMIPTVTMGNSYTAIPFKNNDGGYYLKTVVIENNTRVSIDGRYYKTLNQGDNFTLNMTMDTVRRITANKRLSVTQFAKGTKCNGHPLPKNTMGDVSQMQLVSDDQFITEANISRVTNTPQNRWVNSSPNFKPENYMNVLVKASDTGKFRMNGKAVPVFSWRPSLVIPGYLYAQLTIDTFNYHLTSSKGFMAYVYGYGNFEGYSYQAGATMRVLHNDFVMNRQCKFDTISFTRVKNDSFTNFTWDFGDNLAGKSGITVKKIFRDTGYYNITMYSKNVKTGAVDSIIKKIYISEADHRSILINDTTVCGYLQFTVVTKYQTYLNKYEWQDGNTLFYREFRQPGLYWEKVTERNGCAFIDTLIIKNFPNPVAKFTSSDSVFCSNGTREIAFTNLSTSIDPIAKSNWDFGDLNVNDTNKIVKHTYKKADLYLVTLRISTVNGCDDVATQLVEIIKAPNVNYSITAADSCFNSNNFTFKNNTVKDTALHVKYKWNFGEGTIITNRNPLSPRTYPAAGKYTASLIYENNNGCSDTMRKIITIYANPKSIFSFITNGQCLKDSVKFTNTSTGLNLPLKSKWEFGDSKTDTLKEPKHLYTKKGLFKIRLVAISPQGCRDTSEKQIKVFGAPAVNFTVNDSVQCLTGNSFSFINTSVNDTGTTVFRQWLYSDGTKTLDTDTAKKTFTLAGKPTIQLKVTNSFGCSDSLRKTLELKKGPLAQFTANSTSECFNDQDFTFNYVPQPGNDSIKSIAWYFNNDSVKNINTISNFKFPAYGQYPVRLRLYSRYGCDGEIIKNIYVNPEPVAKFTVQTPDECFKGHSFKIKNQSTIPNGSLKTSQWDFGDATTSNVQNPPDKKYVIIGNYPITYRVVSDSGCSDTATALVKLHPNAVVSIPAVPPGCENEITTLKSSATVTSGSIVSYLWDFGDGQTGSNANTTHFYRNAGVYIATVTTITDNNCRDSASANIKIITKPTADFSYVHFNRDNNGIRFIFNDQSTLAGTWSWQFGQLGSSSDQNPDFTFKDTTSVKVRLIVSNQNICYDTLIMLIPVLDKIIYYFPNVISGNGDNLNDGFGLDQSQFNLVKSYRLRVYNRWGGMVFDSEKKEEHWLVPDDPDILQGVYVYKAQIRDIYNRWHEIRGVVEVLR